jgi:hypothetical protein
VKGFFFVQRNRCYIALIAKDKISQEIWDSSWFVKDIAAAMLLFLLGTFFFE